MRTAQWISIATALALGCSAAPVGPQIEGEASGRGDVQPDGWQTGTFENMDPRDFEHKWAIDMTKVREVGVREVNGNRVGGKYKDVERFFGVPASQLVPTCEADGEKGNGLEMTKLLLQAKQDPTAAAGKEACLGAVQPEFIYNEERQAVDPLGVGANIGGSYAWGNMQTLNFDHDPHMDNPEEPILNYYDEINGERVYIDAPGYLNIIALKNGARHKQDEIHSYLRNGDILVYVHPEDMDQQIQFGAHHAAMYYDTGEGPAALATDENGNPYFHHIDNPTSYGPAFNAGPSSTPFHVFRFNPNSKDGLVNGGVRDAEGFFKFPCTESAEDFGLCVEAEDGPYFKMTDQMAQRYALMARNWGLMNNENAPFADFQTLNAGRHPASLAVGSAEAREEQIEQLEAGFAGRALNRQEMRDTYCAGLVYTNLSLGVNFPLNKKVLGNLWSSFWGDEGDTTFSFDDGYLDGKFTAKDLTDGSDNLPQLGMMPIEPIQGSDIIANWAERYFAGKAFPGNEEQARMIRGAVVGSEQMTEMIVRRFSVIDWDTDSAKLDAFMQANEENGNGTDAAIPPPVTAEAVGKFVQAYVAGGRSGEPYQAMYAAEAETDKRYMYPPIYHVEANRPDSLISYVGTVVHADLLKPLPGFEGGTDVGEVEEFFQGGPDSSQYAHYYVRNGSSHTQRIFQVDSGPETVGKGSTVTTRISAADWHDLRVVLHPAGSFSAKDSLYACEREEVCLDNPRGVLLPINKHVKGVEGARNLETHKWVDRKISWNLVGDLIDEEQRFESGKFTAAGCYVEGTSTFCPEYDWETKGYKLDDNGDIEYLEIEAAHGQWTLTLIDVGDNDRDAYDTVPYCTKCDDGGAHSNQWVLKIRNDQ